jgi:Ni/Co efflux regulator RcnB
MKRLMFFATALSLLAASTGVGSAQQRFDRPSDQVRPDQGRPDGRPDQPRFEEHQNQHGPDHADWRRGGRIDRNDWSRGERVGYREHHFRKPPRGYEWRQVDGRFVLGAIATGVIAEIIQNNR